MPVLVLTVELEQESDAWAKLATVATFLAVLVALFGPLLLDRLRRPRLEVTVASDLVSTLASDSDVQRLTVNVTNRGRRQANDVQALLSVEAPIEVPGVTGANRIEAFQAPVPFIHREGGKWSFQYSVAIPQGFARPLHLLIDDIDGLRLVTPAEREPEPLADGLGLEDGEYRVVLDLVGSNFRVLRYEGRLE